jgi:hypothetical protein
MSISILYSVTQYGTVNLNEFEILVKKKKINKKNDWWKW